MWRSNGWNQIIYALWSPFYDLLVRAGPLRRARQRAMEMADWESGEEVLLVGVGTGEDLRLLPAGVTAVGVDLSGAMLAKARGKLPVEGCEVRLERADAMELPFGDEEFDGAVLTLILSVVADGRAALGEAVRVVRPGGRILVFDKFLPAGKRPTLLRRLLNVLTSVFGTNINREFDPMREGLPVEVEQEERSLFGGAYRAVLLRKRNRVEE